MSANGYQLAVLEAARALRRGGTTDEVDALYRALTALDEHEQVGSLDRLLAQLEQQSDVRALYALRRQIRNSTRVRSDGLSIAGRRCWPAVKTAEDFAALDPGEIRDVRNAGLKTWERWADALRAIGIDPTWAEALQV